jgi:hypothetical protein
MRNLLLICIVIFLGNGAIAQDTLQLLNGKTKLVKIIQQDYDWVSYRSIKNNGEEGRKHKKNLEHVFAIAYKDSSVAQIYKKDSLYDNYWSVNEMKFYLEGRRQARKHFRPYKTFIMGVAVGTGVAMYSIFPPIIKRNDTYTQIYDSITNTWITVAYKRPVALSVPLPYWEILPLSAFVYGASVITNNKKFEADKMELFKNKMFLMGYKETAVNRQVYAAAGASFGSHIITIASYLIFDPAK